jgi:hypothetical protein
MKGLFSRISLATGLGVVILGATSIPAFADEGTPPPPPGGTTSVDTSMCTTPEVSQPFLGAKDNHFYTLMAGQNEETGFTGDGWVLNGGATIVETTLPNGSTVHALSIPSGGEAVSPTICVNKEFPVARTMVRNAEGGDGVNTYISYEGTKTWETPKASNKFHGNSHKEWTLSQNINLQPNKSVAWQRMRLLFVGGGKGSTFEIVNFYVDPRMSR